MQGMRIGFKTALRVGARALVLLVGLFAVVACATGGSRQSEGDRLEILATTSIIGDVVSSVVGDSAAVEVLLPPGVDPHDFEPSPQQVASINDADLVVTNGLGLEEGLTDVIEAAAAEGTPVLRLAEGLDPLPVSANDGSTGGDPHFWHDPDRMATAIDHIVGELAVLDDTVDWDRRAAAYRAQVSAAGDEADEILSVVPAERRTLVTSHDSLDYFADRFGFEVAATVIPGGDTLGEPSGREIAELVDTIDETGVPAIFADTANPTTLADTVAAEAGRTSLGGRSLHRFARRAGKRRRDLCGDDPQQRPPGGRGPGNVMEWLTAPLSEPFMQRALLGGILAAVTTSVVGTWVVMRGLSFMGDALAHGVVPGIALAVVVGFDVMLGAVLSALVMIGGINLVHRRSRLAEDAGIGLLFVGMLALGVIIISRAGSYAASLSGILFGDALGVTAGDLVLIAIGTVVALVASVVFYRPFLALAFNEQKAEVLGLKPAAANALLLALITLAVVTSFRTVGSLLVFGLLVAPPATAALVSRRVPVMMVVAAAIGILAVLVGLLISWYAGTAAGATMAGVAVAIFFVVLVGRDLLAGLGRRSVPAGQP